MPSRAPGLCGQCLLGWVLSGRQWSKAIICIWTRHVENSISSLVFFQGRHYGHYPLRREDTEVQGVRQMPRVRQLAEVRPGCVPWLCGAKACAPHCSPVLSAFLRVPSISVMGDLWWPYRLHGHSLTFKSASPRLPLHTLALSHGLHHKTSLSLQPGHEALSHAIEASSELTHNLFHVSLDIKAHVWGWDRLEKELRRNNGEKLERKRGKGQWAMGRLIVRPRGRIKDWKVRNAESQRNKALVGKLRTPGWVDYETQRYLLFP